MREKSQALGNSSAIVLYSGSTHDNRNMPNPNNFGNLQN